MPPDGNPPELAEIEALIAEAEAELAVLRQRLECGSRAPDPSDPFNPVGCLEIWLAALYATRAGLLHASGQAPSRPN